MDLQPIHPLELGSRVETQQLRMAIPDLKTLSSVYQCSWCVWAAGTQLLFAGASASHLHQSTKKLAVIAVWSVFP